MTFINRDLTGILDFSKDEVVYILDKAAIIKKALRKKDIKGYRLAEGKDLLAALLFYENSTRTRTSFEIAALRLGMNVTGFSSTEGTSVKKGESLKHTLDMYEAYQTDCLIMRHHLDGSARFAARHLNMPVFNAGDGKHEHPTQTLLDLFTIREHLGRIHDFDMGIAGDLKFGRTAHSLAVALTRFEGVRLHLFSHPSLAMPDEIVKYVSSKGVEINYCESMRELAGKTDMLYQTRIQKERMPDLTEFDKAKNSSEFTAEIMALTKPQFGLMHPLPVDKTAPSIAALIDSHPKALYKIQAGNGIPTRLTELALALGLLGNDFEGEVFSTDKVDDTFITSRPLNKKPPRENVSIRPIRNNGVVIDHMYPYREDILIRVLNVRERKDIYRAATVKSVREPGNVKGMLMIENRIFSEHELKTIASVAPDCTVNVIEGSRVTQKIRLKLPSVIDNIHGLMCTNKGCISRPEHLESVQPRMIRAGENLVKCDWCGEIMTTSNMISF